jgi:hypothetical protein
LYLLVLADHLQAIGLSHEASSVSTMAHMIA